MEKIPYICGTLTEFPHGINPEKVKSFYSRLGDVFSPIIGARAFVPHERFDPVQFPHFTDEQVFDAENEQITKRTSLIVAVNEGPTWGGGAEISIAGEHKIPVVFLNPKHRKIARFITGLAKRKGIFQGVIEYNSFDEAIVFLNKWANKFFIVKKQ